MTTFDFNLIHSVGVLKANQIHIAHRDHILTKTTGYHICALTHYFGLNLVIGIKLKII